jgi:hypothetical protein
MDEINQYINSDVFTCHIFASSVDGYMDIIDFENPEPKKTEILKKFPNRNFVNDFNNMMMLIAVKLHQDLCPNAPLEYINKIQKRRIETVVDQLILKDAIMNGVINYEIVGENCKLILQKTFLLMDEYFKNN